MKLWLKSALTGASVCVASLALAQSAEKEGAEVVRSGSAAQLLSVLVALAAVIALILLLSWCVKKLGGGSGWLKSPHMRVVASMPLGTRERLLLVDVAGTQILLGVTPQTVRQLHVFDEPVVTLEASAERQDFAEKLLSVMKSGGASGPKSNPAEVDDAARRS